MTLSTTHNETSFGVGDVIRVHQKTTEKSKKTDKHRIQIFEGTVIRIKGRGMGKTFTIRRIGAQKIGIEMIYPVALPSLQKIEVVRSGTKGARQSKLYYLRDKSKKETELIYTREKRKQ